MRVSKTKPSLTITIVSALIWLAMMMLGGASWQFDARMFNLLYAGEHPNLIYATRLFTNLGGWVALTLFTLLSAIILVRRNERRKAALLILIIASGRVLVEIQKYLIGRPRPPEMDHLVAVQSMSFPSGHAASSMLVYLTIALLLCPRPIVIAGAIALSILIGISRLLLGVHWPSDVVGGWAFGLLWTLGMIRFLKRGERV
jgi:undecaprenyl-diphosphatase